VPLGCHLLLNRSLALLLPAYWSAQTCRNHGRLWRRYGRDNTAIKGATPTYALAWTKDGKELQSAGFQRVGPEGIASFTLRIGERPETLTETLRFLRNKG
jgi:hypothetical protein